MRNLAAPLVVALAAPLGAQVWVVDAAAGPGSHFTEIATAVAAVPSGAVIEVRPGTYLPFTISGKGLAVLGGPGVRVYGLWWPTVGVTGVPAGERVELRGLELAAVSVVARLSCTNSAGTILVDGCRSDPATSLVGGQLAASNCAHLHVRGSTFTSSTWFDVGMQLDQSNVTLTGCTITAPNCIPLAATAGTVDVASTAIVASSVAPTIALNQAHLVLRALSTVVASNGRGAIAAGSGNVVVDPAVILANAPGQPFSSGLAVVTQSMPMLAATPGLRGGVASASLSGSQPLALLALGAPGAPVALPGVTHPSWLVPGSEIAVAIGAQPLVGSYTVPNAPWVLGVALAWQGAGIGGTGNVLLSNPAVVGHR